MVSKVAERHAPHRDGSEPYKAFIVFFPESKLGEVGPKLGLHNFTSPGKMILLPKDGESVAKSRIIEEANAVVHRFLEEIESFKEQ